MTIYSIFETHQGWVQPNDDAIVNMQDCPDNDQSDDDHEDQVIHFDLPVKSRSHLFNIFKACASSWAPFIENMKNTMRPPRHAT